MTYKEESYVLDTLKELQEKIRDMPIERLIKETHDDIDADDGIVFNRWYADMSYSGIAIDWEAML